MGGWVGGCALSVCLQEKSQHMNGGDCRESAVAWERGDPHSLSSAKGEGGFLPGLLRHHKGNGPWSHDPPLLERLQESIWEPLIIHTWDKAPGQKGINSGEELWRFIVKVFTRLHLLLSLGVCGFVLNFWSICDHPINRQQNIYADTRMWQCVCVCVCVPWTCVCFQGVLYSLWPLNIMDFPGLWLSCEQCFLSLVTPPSTSGHRWLENKSVHSVSFQWLEWYGFLAFVLPCPYTPHISWGSLHLSNPTLTILQREMCHDQVQKQDGDHYHFPVLS